MTLEQILQKFFGCNKPFLKRKRICGYWTGGGEREPDYTWLTQAGGRAYGNLTGLLYALEPLLGKEFDANRWVTILDQIASEEEY